MTDEYLAIRRPAPNSLANPGLGEAAHQQTPVRVCANAPRLRSPVVCFCTVAVLAASGLAQRGGAPGAASAPEPTDRPT